VATASQSAWSRPRDSETTAAPSEAAHDVDKQKTGLVKDIKRRFNNFHGIHEVWTEDHELATNMSAARHQRLRRGLRGMEAIVLVASVLSAIVVGLEADIEWEGWLVINGILLIIFWADVFVKIWVYGIRTYFTGRDWHWNRFDFLTTLFSTLDWLNEVIRDFGFPTVNAIPLRILRIARLARFVRGTFFKDLNALIYGFLYGLRPLFWAVFVLLIVSYSLGLMMRLYVGKDGSPSPIYGPSYFGDVRTAMYNVFRCLNNDCTTREGFPLVLKIGDSYGWLPKISYAVVVLILTLGLLNVVLALFVERVLEGAKYSETMRTRLEVKEANFLRSIRANFDFIDDYAEDYYSRHPEDLTGETYLTISKGFFKELLHTHRFVDILHMMGIRLDDLGVTGEELFEVLSPDGLPLSFDNMLQEMNMMRGEARVTLQVLTLAVLNKSLGLVQRLCDKFNVKHNDYIVPSQVRTSDGVRGVVAFQGIQRLIALDVGVAMKETE